jgi:PIN domain nuclease of toxin-antitoxin system
MRILLDTHSLLWAAKGILSGHARSLIEDTANEMYFSAVNLWEIEIKHRRLSFDPNALHQNLLKNGYRELAITTRHVLALSRLPALHGDPFDRILIAQALSERLLLLTADKMVKQYGEHLDCILALPQ